MPWLPKLASLGSFQIDFDVVARPHDVLAADLERVEAEDLGQLVHGAFHGEGGLRGAVAAEAAARDHVGVDDAADALLVGAAIGRERARHGGGQGLAGVVAVGAGVGHHLDVECRERAVLPGADLDLGRHLVPRRGADELVLAGPLPFHRAAVELHAGEQRQVFRHHLLLAAEAAADALGEDVDLGGGNAHQVGELGADRERALRAGAHVPAAVLALVGDRAVGLEMDVLHARGRVGVLVDDVGLLEALRHVADLALQGAEDVAVVGDDLALVVEDRRAGFHGGHGIEHRRQDLVVDDQGAHAGLGRRLALADHGGETLADEAGDVVEHVGVVGVDEMVLVQRRAVEPARHVLPGVDGDDAGDGERLALVDLLEARMGMRRAQHLEVQHALDGDVHRVVRLARQDGVGEGVGQAGAQRLAGDVVLDVLLAVQGIDDRAVAGAAADVALERMRQVGLVGLVERGRGRRHHHAGGAVAALEGLRVMEGLLDGMQLAVLGEAFDGGDLLAFAAEGRHQAGMERLAVHPHRAGAAVAGVAAFLDAEHFQVAQEGAQALAGLRFGRVQAAIDLVLAHDSSARILFSEIVGDVALVGRRAVDVVEPGVGRQALVDRLAAARWPTASS